PFYPDNGSPTAADQYNVLINQTGTPYTVTLTPSVTVSSVELASPNATLQLVDGLKTNSLDVTDGTVTLGTTSCCGHDLDVYDDITMNNGSIRLVMSQDQSQPTWLRFLDTATPQAISGQGEITFVQGALSQIFPGKELDIGPNIVVDSTSGLGEFR